MANVARFGRGAGASVSIVPHSLRLGTGLGQDGDRTWQDFGALFDVLHDGSASPAFHPVDGDKLIAAGRRDPHPVLPVPAPLAFDKAPAAPDFDGIPLLREGERVPPDYRGLPPTPWAPFARRRTPDALAGWGTHPGRPGVEP